MPGKIALPAPPKKFFRTQSPNKKNPSVQWATTAQQQKSHVLFWDQDDFFTLKHGGIRSVAINRRQRGCAISHVFFFGTCDQKKVTQKGLKE